MFVYLGCYTVGECNQGGCMVEEQRSKRALPIVEIVEESKVEKKPELKPEPNPVVPETKPVKEVVRPTEESVRIPEARSTGPGWGMFFAGMATMLLLVILSGGLWWKFGMGTDGLTQATPEPEVVEATPTPMPTPEPVVLTPADFEVVVLNGSGETGLAGTTATQLEALGYEVTRTGNATEQAETTISLGERAATLSAEILKDLEPVLGQVEVVEEPLTDELGIEIILGQDN
jgi:hypothetical protein